ncbi:MAG: hypothetical protein NC409_10705 [Clostridium sp.]|nr:hypothetical protein [Clostridium sp.]
MSGEEERFLKKLTELKETARLQGHVLSEEQVREFREELHLDAEKEQLLYDYFKQNHIGVGQPVEAEAYLSDGERSYLELYLNELKALPKVSDGERRALSMAAMAGETAAKKKLVEAYLPEVVEISKLYAGQGVYLEDLIGEGNVALALGVEMLGALEQPDEVPGMLGKMMMDAMEEYIGENMDAKKVNQKVLSRVQKTAEQAKALAQELRRKVTVEELMQESGLSEREIRDAIRISAGGIEEIDEGAEQSDGISGF